MFQVNKMMKCRMKMNEIFGNNAIFGDTDTFFYLLHNDAESYPLVANFIGSNYAKLNIDYFGGYSADKFISPLLKRIYDYTRDAENPFNALNRQIANIIYNRFADKWKHIYDALMTEYNPLENYSMEEIRTPDLTFEDTENVNTEITTNRETSATSKYKGFNANDPVTISKTDGTDDVTTSGASADNETQKTTTETGTETLTRSGNIGVTTSQQMLESEFKVRQYDFYKMIYNDIDSVLCLSIY